VEAFNPGFGAAQLAQTLFGKANRWGKLPYTMYDSNYTKEISLFSYDMSLAPGRSYKYYVGKPLFEFGTGLSLTSFDVHCTKKNTASLTTTATTAAIQVGCLVKNIGTMEGDEVVLAFHSASDAIRSAVAGNPRPHPVPIKSLLGFERVTVAAGGSVRVAFSFGVDELQLVNAEGNKTRYKGERFLIFSNGAGSNTNISVTV
jgi:beta-D-xylosidase 4